LHFLSSSILWQCVEVSSIQSVIERNSVTKPRTEKGTKGALKGLNGTGEGCQGNSLTSKHLEDYYGRGSSAEANPKSSDEQAGKGDGVASILSQPMCDVFVQHDKSFRRTDRKQYEKMLEARTDDLMSITPSESIQAASAVQTAFHNVSFIIQGFLSGFGTSHAIFAFAFADIDILHKSYTWLAMPIQATFYACFVISTIAALDRLEISSSLLNNLKRGLSLQSGGLDILLCLIGTAATLTLELYEKWLAIPMKQQEKIQDVTIIDALLAWRMLSGIRAIAGLLNWLLLALSPNSNNLLRQIRNPVCQHIPIFFFCKN
uniref:Transmembrane protein n=1 Tax=Elaeophora elaphi TaxID=1147741 RepID=A0A0R3RYY6_9BILA